MEDAMKQYLVAIHHPDDFVPYSESAETARDIDALNGEMNRQGIVVFVGGMGMPAQAKSIRVKEGRPVVSDGPYLETKEHVGGFWVLSLPNIEQAVEWGKKAAVACRAPVEVRAFNWDGDYPTGS
jgi:hypothetical protein